MKIETEPGSGKAGIRKSKPAVYPSAVTRLYTDQANPKPDKISARL